MKVLKYGGSSLENISKIKAVAECVKNKLKSSKKLIVVVSAMGKTTNNLTALASQFIIQPKKRELDQLISIGENQSAVLMTLALQNLGVSAISLTGWQAGIFTDNSFGGAFIEEIEISRINSYLKTYDVIVVTGFQGVTLKGDITTLGKGGSDTTAVALAGKFGSKCEIFTDVQGVFTVDPKVFKDAKKLKKISYDDLMEASINGAKVMETRSVEIASKYNVELYISKSLEEKPEGTKVGAEVENFEAMPIKNLAVQDDVLPLKIQIKKNADLPKIFEIFSQNFQKVQGGIFQQKNQKKYFSCYINEKNAKNIEILLKKHDFNYIFEKSYCKLTLVGSGFQTHSMVLKNIFKWLADEKITPKFLTISEVSMSFLVGQKNKEKAIHVLAKNLGL